MTEFKWYLWSWTGGKKKKDQRWYVNIEKSNPISASLPEAERRIAEVAAWPAGVNVAAAFPSELLHPNSGAQQRAIKSATLETVQGSVRKDHVKPTNELSKCARGSENDSIPIVSSSWCVLLTRCGGWKISILKCKRIEPVILVETLVCSRTASCKLAAKTTKQL